VKLHIIALLALPLAAQVPTQQPNPCIKQACFMATQSATVTSAGTTTLTIQQPATGSRQINFTTGIVTCDTQPFTVAQSQNGTAASATAGTAVALIPLQVTGSGAAVTATAKVFTASNVGGGTAVGPVLPFAAGSVTVVDLSMRTWAAGASATTNNYSIKLTNTGPSSCTGAVTIYWSERI
jgi:hypothetical protein